MCTVAVVIDWYSTVQYTLLAVHCLHTKYIVLYLVIGIAIDPTVDSLHPCIHVLAPGNYPLVIPSGCVSRAYLVHFEQSEPMLSLELTGRQASNPLKDFSMCFFGINRMLRPSSEASA